MFKPKGSKNVTNDMKPQEALEKLKEGLTNNSKSYIYHCYNHYMVPVGYEEMPDKPEIVYKKDINPSQLESWIIIADNSRKHQTFHSVRWDDIVKDLNMENPNYIDIRNLAKGVQNKNSPDYKGRCKKGKNSHCLIEFSSV